MLKKPAWIHFFVLSIFAIPLALTAKESSSSINKGDSVAVKNEPQSPARFQPFTGKVIGSKVRLRTQPNKESAVVREVNTGEMLGIADEQSEFFGVRPPKGIKGYVFRTFILDNVVEGDKVNIRLHPDIESPAIGKLRAGDKVDGIICPSNNKWLEITLPETTRFYIAKEYVENVGSFEMLAEMETRYDDALHKLNSVFHFARGEIQKSFEEISFETIHQKFDGLVKEFADLPEVVEKTKEASNLIEETYLQKKIAFLESKADRSVASRNLEMDHIQKLASMGRELKGQVNGEKSVTSDVETKERPLSENTSVWHSLEESFYHLWAGANAGKSMEDFYEDSAKEAVYLTGVIEAYARPVKNRPGDFMLRNDSAQPIGFLYSTKINLQDFVGKKVTLVTTPRPNNNFAFPAYFVLGVE